MKANKKILLIALSTMLIVCLTLGVSMIAFADEATKDHEFNSKNDVVFEDFDRGDISNTVTMDGDGVITGEKPYLHVEYEALTNETAVGERNSQIYKQGSGTLGAFADVASITLRLRAPKGDVELADLNFALRGIDAEEKVFVKSFTALKDIDGEALPELTTEWQDYQISLAMSYEDTDVYPGTEDTVRQSALLAFHVFANVGKTGTLDIASVSCDKTGNIVLNDFIGGENVESTAKIADSGTWWAGSSTGYIVKRNVKMTGGSVSIVKDTAVGKFSYAVIEATGDVEHLKVATTTDGTTWSTPAAYDGYSVTLTGEEKGFKLVYDGTDADGVTINRIYLTNVIVPESAVAIPVIDAATAKLLENFDVAQKGFTGVWEDMSTAPELAIAGLEYRLSYSNGDKVEIKDGSLVFDATALASDGYINFKFKSKTAAKGDYVVFKVKAEDGANLDSFRFALGNADDVMGDVIWTNQMKAGVDYPVALLGNDNPYKSGDWYYVVANLDESGFKLFGDGYSIMDIYYSGAGKLYVDEVFFCNALDVIVPNVEKDLAYPDAHIDVNASVGYAPGGYMYVLNEGYGTTLEFDITAKEDDFDISNYRIQFEGVGTYWASQNSEGTLLTADGKKLNELTYVKDTATHVVIDLAASGIEGPFMHLHSHVSDMGGFTLTNVKLHTSTPARYAKDLDEASKHIVKEDDGETNKTVNLIGNTSGATQYGGYVGSLTGKTGLFQMDITVSEDANISKLRLEFLSGKTLWASQNDQGVLYTSDGKMLSEVEFEPGVAKTVVIDLAKSEATLSDFHIHVELASGSIKLENITVTPYVDYITPVYAPKYAQQLEILPVYLDTVDPTVSITTAKTATEGDVITVAYTASDNLTATADLTVNVTVTKDGNAVTLSDNKFTAEAGVYTVTVKVTDINGNEASDTIQITVSAKQTGGDETPEDPGKGLTPGAIAGIVIGCVAAVAIAAGVVVFVLKRKKSK